MSGADVRSAGAAALATLLGACALTPVFSSAAWLLPVLAVVLVVLAGGLLLRVGGPALWARLGHGRPVPGRLGRRWGSRWSPSGSCCWSSACSPRATPRTRRASA